MFHVLQSRHLFSTFSSLARLVTRRSTQINSFFSSKIMSSTTCILFRFVSEQRHLGSQSRRRIALGWIRTFFYDAEKDYKRANESEWASCRRGTTETTRNVKKCCVDDDVVIIFILFSYFVSFILSLVF